MEKQMEVVKKQGEVKKKTSETNVLMNQRKTIEMAYPVPLAFGKTLDQMLIQTKSLVESSENQSQIAQMAYDNVVVTINNNPPQNQKALKDQQAALANVTKIVSIAQQAYQSANNTYNQLKNEEATLLGNGIRKAKNNIAELEEKKKDADNANINPTVANGSLTNGRVTYRSVANKEEAKKTLLKEIDYQKKYIENLEAFDKRMANENK